MDANEVNEALTGFITEQLLHGDGDGLTLHTPLLEWGIVDSVSMLGLLTFVQTTFDVTIPDREVSPRNFQTIAALSALILRVHGDASNGA